jgi:ABC-type taurine transport system ATPase subunit
MGQRLGIAVALLADRQVLILVDEPINIADCSTEEFIERSTEQIVVGRNPDVEGIAQAVGADGGKPLSARTAC